MTQQQSNRKTTVYEWIIIILSVLGLMVCFAVLFPQVRRLIMDLAEQMIHNKILSYKEWVRTLLSYAMGGICMILFFDYCTLTGTGKTLVNQVKQEIRDCLSAIDFRSLIKPGLIISGVYLLGMLAIILSNVSYRDDIMWSMFGSRNWHDWSRYVTILLSYFIQPEISMTDISPIPQLLAVPILSCCSILLVYLMCDRKITLIRLLASIPLGLSPYILECLSYKFMAPYFAFSILTCIIPFLFIAYKRAFLFCSIISLLIMCMTYQAASGIYMLIVIILCFQDWNGRKKTHKEILSFLGIAAFAYCFALLFFRFCLMRYIIEDGIVDYASNTMFPISQLLSGLLININNYTTTIYNDLSLLWKIGIALALLFFIAKAVRFSAQKKILSFLVAILVIGVSFILAYGPYILLAKPLFSPRALFGFGIFLAIIFIWVVSDYKIIATITVIAVNWCLFTFAFSYGNALADQARYAEFRIGLLLHDLSALYPDANKDEGLLLLQLDNSIDFTPSIKNIARHNPIIEKLVQKRLGDDYFDSRYYRFHFNFDGELNLPAGSSIDFITLNLPVVLDSYYHTIRSDGKHILINLKH